MDATDDPPIPEHVRDLFARWSDPCVWLRVSRARANLANALVIEEAEYLSAHEDAPACTVIPGGPSAGGHLHVRLCRRWVLLVTDLPTTDGVRTASRELDALAAEHDAIRLYIAGNHPALLGGLPAIPPTNVLDEREAVRCAERMTGAYGRVMEAARPTGNCGGQIWSERLRVNELERILDSSRNGTIAELRKLEAAGRAEEANRQAWKIDLRALDANQRGRYDALIEKRKPKGPRKRKRPTGDTNSHP